MIDLESLAQRNHKIKQQRFGISVIFEAQNSILYEQLYNYKEQFDEIFPNCFVWYPRWHMTLIRCKSTPNLFSVNPDDESFKRMKRELSEQPKIELINTGNTIALDGVLRCYFSEIKWLNLNAVDNFYLGKGLQYKIIDTPWIALGNVKIDKLEEINSDMNTVNNILNKKYISNICIQSIKFVLYEDILLQKNQCIGNAFLGECV